MSYNLPPKPATEDGFRKPVSWFGGRDLIAGIKWMILYTVFKDKIDHRDWMHPNVYPNFRQLETILGRHELTELTSITQDDVNTFWKEKASAYRKWKEDNYKNLQNGFPAFFPDNSETEFWFDYISDSGDGQTGTYNVAYLCYSDFWLDGNEIRTTPKEKATLLPRGSFLFVGGDTAYHISDYSTLNYRFQIPFHWAFASARKFLEENFGVVIPNQPKQEKQSTDILSRMIERSKTADETLYEKQWKDGRIEREREDGKTVTDSEPLRPLFAIPANHDYYDLINGFNRQFRRPITATEKEPENVVSNGADPPPQLAISGFERKQEASYLALRLPFGWWMFGLDTDIGNLDFRQKRFFKTLVDANKPEKLIVATPGPTTVFAKHIDKEDPTSKDLLEIGVERPFLKDGQLEREKLRLDLVGDIHHYARYWAKDEGSTYASVVAGGGGAFFDSTETQVNANHKDYVKPEKVFPSEKDSRKAISKRIFDLKNIREGGYIGLMGAIMTGIIYFSATVPQPTKEFFDRILSYISRIPFLQPDIQKEGLLKGVLQITETPVTLKYFLFWFSLTIISIVGLGISIYAFDKINSKLITRIKTRQTNKQEEKKTIQKVGVVYLIALIIFLLNFLYACWQWGFLVLPFKTSVLVLSLLTVIGCFFALKVEPVNTPSKPQNLWQIGVVAFPSLLLFLFVSILLPYYLNEIYRPPKGKIVEVHHFIRSLSFLSHIIVAVMLAVLGSLYTKWRINITKYLNKEQQLKVHDEFKFIPVWILNIVGVIVLCLVFLTVRNQPAIYVATDLLFALIIAAVTAGVFTLSSIGWALQDVRGKSLFGLFGVWHLILQVAIPFLLVRVGNWIAILVVLGLVLIMHGASHWASKLSEESIIRKGLAPILMRKFPDLVLFIMWLAFGVVLILVPLWFSKRYAIEGHSTFLPKVVADIFVGLTRLPPNWTLTLLALFAAIYLGHRLSRVWLSWYFAVGQGFNGHNNEVGGASRIEGYKQILRIRLTETSATVYSIGFAKENIEGERLNIELVDKFTLGVDK